MSRVRTRQAAKRLIVVCEANLSGEYSWLPAARMGDVVVALDGMAHTDLADRGPLLFDHLESWEERSVAEELVTSLIEAVTTHPSVTATRLRGHSLIDFAAYRLWTEMGLLLRGWTIAHAVRGARELVCDPRTPAALVMGVRAGLGLDPAATSYSVPPALPGQRYKRALARPLMRALVACSRPGDVRIAAVAAGKLALALASLRGSELRALGVGAMPFPGLDHGNGALLAMRRRIPLLATYGPRETRAAQPVRIAGRLELGQDVQLNLAITLLVERLMSGVAPELEQAVDALAGLEAAPSLEALLLPSAAYGASRLLVRWAHERKLQVGAMQHGIYRFRRHEGGDRLADLVFGWGADTPKQMHSWPEPRPRLVPVGIPGTPDPVVREPPAQLTRALIATTSSSDTALESTSFCERFIDSLTPGLRRLVDAHVELRLRPHPAENPEVYRRLLGMRGLDAKVVLGGSFSEAAEGIDILISSSSSVAFEAAASGLPVLMWLGGVPPKVRMEHLVVPWTESAPGTFSGSDDFGSLVDDLLERPARGFALAHDLRRRLVHFAQPFDPGSFRDGLRTLVA